MKTNNPPRFDPLKALILERLCAYNHTDNWLAEQLGVSRKTFSRMKNHQHTDEWTLGQIKKCCIVLNITKEQFAKAITYYIYES